MKIAVIDCGTNTFNLLVTEATRDKWHVLFQNKLPVKLGAGGFEDRVILPARFVRGLDAMMCHKQNIQNFQCEKTFAFATSAIRETQNGQEFVQKVKSLFGIEIEVIDGNREAELIYDGVSQSIDLGDEKALIMDIGGGSTEFVIADGKQIYWKQSFLLGVSRLNDLVKPDNKLSSTDTDYLDKILGVELQPLQAALKEYDVKRLIGSSGSFDTVLMMHLHKIKQETEGQLLHSDIPLRAFHDIHNWLVQSTMEQRLQHPVIPGMRAEYMPLASYLIKHVLQMHAFTTLTHSAYSLKEGAMRSILSRIDWPAAKATESEDSQDNSES